MNTRVRALPFDPDALTGLSSAQIVSHHQNDYRMAVTRLDAARAGLATKGAARTAGSKLINCKREALLSANLVRLHELYFDSLGGGSSDISPLMALALQASFGSVDSWHEEFVAISKTLRNGSGWVLLMFDPHEAELVNHWAANDADALLGAVPLLALDMNRNAYDLDYGAAADRYVDAFMSNIDWAALQRRYQRAIDGASEHLGADHEATSSAVVFDVRRPASFEQAATMLQGACWRDPASVNQWAPDLPADQMIIVYCVYGHEISRAVALRLAAAGLDARFLRGGIEGWHAAHRPLMDRLQGQVS